MSLNPASRIRQDVQSMQAYAIQDSSGMVKLDAMENPHRLPPELQAELGRRLGSLALNRYPDGRVNDLRSALAEYAQMPAGCELGGQCFTDALGGAGDDGPTVRRREGEWHAANRRAAG